MLFPPKPLFIEGFALKSPTSTAQERFPSPVQHGNGRRSNSAFLRTPEHVKICQMIPNGFSLSLGWADHFPEAAKTVNEYS